MADNYLEKKMEEFRSRAFNSRNGYSKKSGTTLSKLLAKNRAYTQFDSKVIVRTEHLKSITEVCNKIEFLGGMQSDDFSFEYITDQEHNAQIIVKLRHRINNLPCNAAEESKGISMELASGAGNTNIPYINLGILLQSMLLRATEMGLNGNYKKIIEFNNSSSKEIEMTIEVGKGNYKCENTQISDYEQS